MPSGVGSNNGMSLSPLQIQRVDAKMIGSDTLTIDNLLLREPEMMESVIAGAVNSDAGYSGLVNPLDFITSGLNNIEYVDNSVYRWDVIATQDNTFPVSKLAPNTAQVGQGGTTFELYFSQPWFVIGQTIFSPKGQHLILTENMYPVDGHYVAKVRLKDPNQGAVDSTEIQINSRWYGSYKAVGERTDANGRDITFSGNAKLQNNLSTIRLDHFVTGDAARAKFLMTITNPNNPKQSVKAWGDWAMLLFMKQIRSDINDLLFKGIPSAYNTQGFNGRDESGYPIMEGAGLEYQIAGSNKYYYSGTLDFRQLESALESLLTDYSATAEGMTFTLVTGRGGMRSITEMIEKKQASKGFTIVDSQYTYTDLEGNLKEYKVPQFKTIRFMNGIVLNLVLNPLQDSKRFQNYKHPKTGYNVESYKMLIFRERSSDGKANVRQVIRKTKENIMTYQAGLVSPYSLGGNDKTFRETANARDGYNISYVTERGIKLADPTGACMFVLNI